MLVNAADATPLGIADGDRAEVRSARGAVQFTARLTDETRAGVVVVEGTWWSKHHDGRGVNTLTDDRTTDMGGGPALHSNLVQVVKLA